ncbi:succinylglutamate desuccinylase/aspartoacylase family protein [Patescibacteria group bacterium]|nr:succinylglutamate desuccinylase/aspartoacylase family protein [Patescibacteria group bacterium]
MVEVKSGYISVFKSVDMANRRIPYFCYDSKVAGPTVWVVAAVHGDEVTGTETVLRMGRYLKRGGLKRGKVFCFPMMNPLAYELITRYEPMESIDLNRCFPGHPKGSIAERIAHKIFAKIVETKPIVVIDLHTDTMESIPYIYLDQVVDQNDSWLVKEIIRYSDLSGINYFVENSATSNELRHSITAALINDAKIPALTVELGGPMLVKERFVEIGLNMIKNSLNSLGMIEGWSPWIYERRIKLDGFYETVWNKYSADYSGIVEYKVRPGDSVRKDEVLARIKNVFDKTVQIIKAQADCVAISCADQSVCFPGTELLMIAERNDNAFKFERRRPEDSS